MLFVTGCNQDQVVTLKDCRNKVFSDALITAKVHSNGIEYARLNGCFQGNKSNYEQIVKKFFLEDCSFFNLSEEEITSIILATENPFVRTKSEESICAEFMDQIIDKSATFDRSTDFEKEVSSVLMQEKYLNCDDDTFAKLALLAAIYVDSITYWNSNLEEILKSSISTKSEEGGWDWDIFWYDLKEIAKADGIGALFGSLLGPNGMLVTAVMESVKRTEEVAEEYYENKENSN